MLHETHTLDASFSQSRAAAMANMAFNAFAK